MNESDQDILICQLVQQMHKHHSWVGETHIQKCSLFLQELLGVPLSYEFAIYKYGPYSSELSRDLTKMRVNFMLDVEPHPPYAPSFVLGTRGQKLVQAQNRYESEFEFVCKRLSPKNTRDLERVSTVYFIKIEMPELQNHSIAERVCELKPHISHELAVAACKEVDEMRESAYQKFPNLSKSLDR